MSPTFQNLILKLLTLKGFAKIGIYIAGLKRRFTVEFTNIPKLVLRIKSK